MIEFPSDLIPMPDVPKHVRKITGMKIHLMTARRWADRGVRGNVLESVLFGTRRYTSQAALEQFLEAITAPGQKIAHDRGGRPKKARGKDVKKRVARATKRLKKAGL